ncbi:DUF5677 domain-containing protein [Streptomyces sp. NPDC001288]|uniref:DUF5677 domain-containing protein n=1 Tax=Streptomyces sp. NPDC001297 TaxID=3364559 RepID=UPI003690B6C1
MAAMLESLDVVTRRFFTEANSESGAIIGNHALNDFDSLIDFLLDGDGRNAARVTRSLYEHLINYCEVTADSVSSERYLAHRAVTANLLGGMVRGTPLLGGPELKKEQNRLKKLSRDSARDLANVLARFGKRFRADWSEKSLRDRAAAHGYERHYDVYRVLSQVTHGSCGGVLGTYADVKGKPVHRVGPSLGLAIVAYLEGISFFRDFVREIDKREGHDTGELVACLNRLIAYWPKYRKALTAIDRMIWPNVPPPPPVAIMAIYGSGRVRWFYWEPALKLMKPAVPPDDAEWIEERLKEKIKSEGIKLEGPDGKPFTTAVTGVNVTPKPESDWFKADAILVGEARPKTF